MESKKLFESGGRPLSPFRAGRIGSRRSSPVSTTQATAHDNDQAISCVSRETSQESCAKYKFLVWAAVRRNGSTRMPEEKRLECPLLHCTKRFASHELMLIHLVDCDFLSMGEYWCYDHMTVERFDDLNCRRCLGQSKRRKMLSMAKKFFHSLGGHKSRKGLGHSYDSGDDLSLPPPPPYHSLTIAAPPNVDAELSATTEILEIDSTEVGTRAEPSDAINPKALFAPGVPELDSVALPGDPFMQWQPSPMTEMALPMSMDADARALGPKPTLQVTTAGLAGPRHGLKAIVRPAPPAPRNAKGLSPSSSVRSTTSTTSTTSNNSTTSNVSSIISPASNWSGAWSMASGINTNLTSPIDLISPADLLAENPFGDAANSYDEVCPNFLHAFYSELPAEVPPQKPLDEMNMDSVFIPFNDPVPSDLPYATNAELTEDLDKLLNFEAHQMDETEACCSETKALVAAAWDALQEHILSSTLKIQHLVNNPLGEKIRSLSTGSIASAGLKTLRRLLNGDAPATALEAICFIHLIYAFSLAVHEDSTSQRSKQLFLQCLSYSQDLPSDERDMYKQLAFEIWQPSELTQAEIHEHMANHDAAMHRRTRLKGKQPENGASHGPKDDALFQVAQDFLDDLESTLILGDSPVTADVQSSELYAKHALESCAPPAANGAFVASVNYVLTLLLGQFSGAPGIASRLRSIHHRVRNNKIISVRRVELELLEAGKSSADAATFFTEYVPTVRDLCDSIYEKHDAGTSRRDVYHELGISMIEHLIREFDMAVPDMSLPGLSDTVSLNAFIDDVNATYGSSTPLEMPFADEDSMACLSAHPDLGMTTHNSVPQITTTPPQPSPSEPPTPAQSTPPQLDMKVADADTQCDLCDYRPKGDPQWFKGSMAKHRKMMHSKEPPKLFKCPYPGCTSVYRNRADNLRQHQIEKNHFVGEETTRRPSKRKKLASEE